MAPFESMVASAVVGCGLAKGQREAEATVLAVPMVAPKHPPDIIYPASVVIEALHSHIDCPSPAKPMLASAPQVLSTYGAPEVLPVEALFSEHTTSFAKEWMGRGTPKSPQPSYKQLKGSLPLRPVREPSASAENWLNACDVSDPRVPTSTSFDLCKLPNWPDFFMADVEIDNNGYEVRRSSCVIQCSRSAISTGTICPCLPHLHVSLFWFANFN